MTFGINFLESKLKYRFIKQFNIMNDQSPATKSWNPLRRPFAFCASTSSNLFPRPMDMSSC